MNAGRMYISKRKLVISAIAMILGVAAIVGLTAYEACRSDWLHSWGWTSTKCSSHVVDTTPLTKPITDAVKQELRRLVPPEVVVQCICNCCPTPPTAVTKPEPPKPKPPKAAAAKPKPKLKPSPAPSQAAPEPPPKTEAPRPPESVAQTSAPSKEAQTPTKPATPKPMMPLGMVPKTWGCAYPGKEKSC